MHVSPHGYILKFHFDSSGTYDLTSVIFSVSILSVTMVHAYLITLGFVSLFSVEIYKAYFYLGPITLISLKMQLNFKYNHHFSGYIEHHSR